MTQVTIEQAIHNLATDMHLRPSDEPALREVLEDEGLIHSEMWDRLTGGEFESL